MPADESLVRGTVVRGSCLCGAVGYEVTGPLGPTVYCHCSTAAKAVPWALGFSWTRGEALLTSYESSPGKTRSFCSRCGSQLVAAWRGEDEVILRAGCIDDEESIRPVAHLWTGDKALWYDLDAKLPLIPRGRQR